MEKSKFIRYSKLKKITTIQTMNPRCICVPLCTIRSVWQVFASEGVRMTAFRLKHIMVSSVRSFQRPLKVSDCVLKRLTENRRTPVTCIFRVFRLCVTAFMRNRSLNWMQMNRQKKRESVYHISDISIKVSFQQGLMQM